MKQNVEQEKQTPLTRKGGISDFKKALLWTVIPFLIYAIFGAVGTADAYYLGAMILYWPVGGAFSLGAIIAGIVFSIRGKRRIAAGIFVGMAIGIAALGVSCYASFLTNESY
jgi:hypothetical protein